MREVTMKVKTKVSAGCKETGFKLSKVYE